MSLQTYRDLGVWQKAHEEISRMMSGLRKTLERHV